MAEKNYFESLTVLRGIAAWWIVLYHFRSFLDDHFPASFIFIVAQGYLAVDLFFILSGFVIYYNYRTLNYNKNDLLTFFAKRFARIYPLHIVILVSYLSIPLLFILYSKFDRFSDWYDTSYYFMSIFLLQNWGFTDTLSWNTPAWSISTEWFSYLAFPFFLFAVSKYLTRFYLVALSFCIVTLILAAYFYLNGESTIGANIPKNGLTRCVLQFFLGILVCNVYLNNKNIFENTLFKFFLVPLLLFTSYYFWKKNINDYYVVSIIFSLLILHLATFSQKTQSYLRATPLYYLGEISYSTYMVHFIIREWFKLGFVSVPGQATLVKVLAVLFAIFIASAILYKFVEKPAQSKVTRVMLNWISQRY